MQTRSDPFRLDGRIALVTGGASGIGEATVKELARAGAEVWIADLNFPAAESLAASIPSARALHLDVTSPESIAAALAQLEFLDILVNNAGIGHVGSIETTEPEDFDRVMNVNVRSVYLVTRAFLPLLLAVDQRHDSVGTIVNVASVSGLVGIRQRFLLHQQRRHCRHDAPARRRIPQNATRQRRLSRHRTNALRRGLPRQIPQAQ